VKQRARLAAPAGNSTALMKQAAKGLRRGAIRGVLRGALATGLWRIARTVVPEGVGVLLYHRIADARDPAFYGFADNVSATRAGFARQLDYLARSHNVIDLASFEAWLVEKQPLPKNSVLITFDDGYADNVEHALPELAARGMPAVLFLATGFVGDKRSFFWDAVAEAFATAPRTAADLPLLGTRLLSTALERMQAAREWIAAAKRLPSSELRSALGRLASALDRHLDPRPPRKTHATWSEIGQLAEGGFTICPHTVHHPILSRIAITAAEQEILASRQEIEERLGYRSRTFAYPNGLEPDFGVEHEELLRKHGFVAAFRSNGGNCFAAEARARPYAIRRICVTHKDDLPRFAAKLAGISRFAS
jgi:peptidoglycan/xylan/chitin deacetylase (PgdA/CDA1 family)